MNTHIFINSAHRQDNVRTVEDFPADWSDFAQIVVPYKEAKEYERNYGDIIPVLAVPKQVPCFLSSQRQWVMEYAIEEGIDAVWFMDDDLKFQWRDDGLKLHNCGESHMWDMYEEVNKHLNSDISIVGISTRLGNNRVEYNYDDICRVTRCYAISVADFQEVGATMAPFEPFLMQDFHINLSFLEKGFKNRVLYNYAQGDAGSNADGGVSVYRTQDLMKKVANWLAKNHPGCVTVKEKKTKGSWAGFDKDKDGFIVRTDVLVHWKKAYKKGKNKGGITRFIGSKKYCIA